MNCPRLSPNAFSPTSPTIFHQTTTQTFPLSKPNHHFGARSSGLISTTTLLTRQFQLPQRTPAMSTPTEDTPVMSTPTEDEPVSAPTEDNPVSTSTDNLLSTSTENTPNSSTTPSPRDDLEKRISLLESKEWSHEEFYKAMISTVTSSSKGFPTKPDKSLTSLSKRCITQRSS